jgi:hypothetical protein
LESLERIDQAIDDWDAFYNDTEEDPWGEELIDAFFPNIHELWAQL